MTVAAAAALTLRCFFNTPTDGSTPAGMIPVINMPITVPAMAESMLNGTPPLNANRFAGEAEPAREWIIGNSHDPAAPAYQALRIGYQNEPLRPGPYTARYGEVRNSGGTMEFKEKMVGYCKPVVPNEKQP